MSCWSQSQLVPRREPSLSDGSSADRLWPTHTHLLAVCRGAGGPAACWPCSREQRGRNPPPFPAHEGALRGGGCGSAVLSACVTPGFTLRSPSCHPHQEGSVEAFCSRRDIKDNIRKFLLPPLRGRDVFCASGENRAQGRLTLSCSSSSQQSYSFCTLDAAPLAAVVAPLAGAVVVPLPHVLHPECRSRGAATGHPSGPGVTLPSS